MSEVVVKFDEAIEGSDGRKYFAQTAAREREDGLWEGWLEFIPIDETGAPLASERETTQPNLVDIRYWAEGLTSVYLEGALQRALDLAQTRRPQAAPEREAAHFARPAVRQRLEESGAIRPHPILDPFSVYAQGEDVLRDQLTALSRTQVESIVSAYGFSPSDSPADIADAPEQKLIDAIVDGVRGRELHG
jgi:hypothetical protein